MNENMRQRAARRPARALIVGAGLAICAVASACPPGSRTADQRAQLPECPESGAWSTFFAANYRELATATPPALAGQVPLSGPITDIPEFNDCQRFLVRRSGTEVFDSLFAIFARVHLDSMEVDSAGRLTGPPIFPMATIYSFHSAYPQLGLEPEFNCLYFVRTPSASSGYEARVVPVQDQPSKCLTAPASPGTSLRVDRVQMPGADNYDYPPVARWDRDTTTEKQFIGIRCGRGWCEVRPRGDASSAAATSRYTRSGSVLFRRAVEIKGWHDEQRLAVPPGGSATAATPSAIVATLIADTLLDKDPVTAPPATTRYAGQWAHVASVALSEPPGIYASKLNLVQSAAPNPVNDVYLCYGPIAGGNSPCFTAEQKRPNCGSAAANEWWGKIESPTAPARFYCITRRAHPGFPIPGVVRWRWTLHDDTMWIRCLDGCCQVQPL